MMQILSLYIRIRREDDETVFVVQDTSSDESFTTYSDTESDDIQIYMLNAHFANAQFKTKSVKQELVPIPYVQLHILPSKYERPIPAPAIGFINT